MARPGKPATKGSSAEIIDMFGGTSQLGFWLDAHPSTVSTWKNKGIPPGRCLQIFRLAVRAGLPLTIEQILKSKPQSKDLVLGERRRVPQARSRLIQREQ